MAPRREQGFMLIALVIAMVVIALLVGAFVSINVTKDLSGPLYVNSTQAFYLAQAGAEYGLRYAADNISAFCADPSGFISGIGTKNIGNGTFTLSINVTDPNNYKLTSEGNVAAIAGTAAKRSIIVENFAQFLPSCGLITRDPDNPPYRHGTNAMFPLLNNASCSLRITRMDISKLSGNQATASAIELNGTQVWSGNATISNNPASPTVFNITSYNLPQGSTLNNYIDCKTGNQPAGNWTITFYFNDCSNNPQTVTIDFTL